MPTAKGTRTKAAGKLSVERIVGRALEDKGYWTQISSSSKATQTKTLTEALGREPTAGDFKALGDAVKAMKRLQRQFDDKPIAS